MRPITVRRRAAAQLLGCGTTKVDELIATGELEARKSGKLLLILTASIDRYVESLPVAKLKMSPGLRRRLAGQSNKTKVQRLRSA
jgi:excisionase family DNA binding protein